MSDDVALRERIADLEHLLDLQEKLVLEHAAAQKVLEERLRQSQKMEAVGQLAGGVAHDFNNLLSVILSYVTMLLQDAEPESTTFADLAEIRLAGERAAGLTRQLLAFSRKQILDPRPTDLNDLIGGMENMLRRLLGEGVAFAYTPAPGSASVLVDRGQFEQVVMNLVLNARDAAGTGGHVSVEIRTVELDDAYAGLHPGVTPGPFVRMTVSDDGPGMDAATAARVFEPFFTTKDREGGTGLGLATVHGIIQQSRGHITVESAPGKGASFQVHLPSRTEPALVATAPSSQPVPPRNVETILLVEDEEQVRRAVRGILRRQGYTVLEAQNGGEAFMICERHHGPIHLLVTDVVMPVMNGREVAERLAPMRPTMRVLYMSGYTDQAIVKGGALESGISFLPKPVTPDALMRKVREVLNAPLGV
jgi:signal transduction histidine kinase